jgi:prophage antirepressor-like protein
MNDNKQNVSLFNFHKQQIRVVEIDGDPWFIVADVCRCLEMDVSKGTGRYLQNLDPAERRVVTKRNYPEIFEGDRAPSQTMMAESGLYKFALRSTKPEAKAFQNWVTREVLPSIRKNGGYIKDQEKVATGEMSGEELALRGYEALMKIYEDMKVRAERAGLKVSPREPRDLFPKNLFRLTCI